MLKTRRKYLSGMFLMLSFVVALASRAEAITLKTQEEVLREVFRKDDEMKSETKTLATDQVEKIKKALGGEFVHYKQGDKAAELAGQRDFKFYYGLKDGKKTHSAVILEEPGKWGPIQFIVDINLDGTIAGMEVLRFTENRGRPIARNSFLRQFADKKKEDAFKIDADIVGVSGATISSAAAAFSAKKAVLIYAEFY